MKKIMAILAVFTLLLNMGVFAWADGGREPGDIGLECRRVESAGGEAFVDVDMVIGSYLIGGLEMLDINVNGKLIAPEDAILINSKVFVREVGVTDESKWCDMHRRASIEPRSDGRTYSVSWREGSDDGDYSALYDAMFKWSLGRSFNRGGGPIQVELVIRARFLVKDPGIVIFSIQDMEARGRWGNIDIDKKCALKVCKSTSLDFIILWSVGIMFLLGLIGLGGCMIYSAARNIKEESKCTGKRKHKHKHNRQLKENSDFGPF